MSKMDKWYRGGPSGPRNEFLLGHDSILLKTAANGRLVSGSDSFHVSGPGLRNRKYRVRVQIRVWLQIFSNYNSILTNYNV